MHEIEMLYVYSKTSTEFSYAIWMNFRLRCVKFSVYVKSEGLPRQAEVAQGVTGRLRHRIFITFRHYKGGRSSAKRTDRLYPRRIPWYSLSVAESTSGHMVLSGVPRKKSSVTPPGIDPGTSRLVAQCLNHYATPGVVFDYFVSSINLTPTCVINFEFLKAFSLKLYQFDYRVLEFLEYVISFLKLLRFRAFRFKIYAKKQ